MIKFALCCHKDHEFESWFADSGAFEKLAKAKQIECPNCGSTKVSKALMAPSVATARKKAASRKVMRADAQKVAAVQAGLPSIPTPSSASAPADQIALLDDDQRKLRSAIKELHNKIVESTVDVGNDFSSEARKIHDGDAPERPIRGQASAREAMELLEDGIPVVPIPMLPDDKN